MFDIPGLQQDPVVYAFPFFAVLIAIELILNAVQHRHLYVGMDTLASIAMGIGSLVIGIAVKIAAFAAFTFLHQFAIFEIGWQWWAWILLLFADDFSFYWHHRLSHEVRILWAAHVNHHSSMHYNLGTALRQSWTEILYKYVFGLWLPLIGFEPIMIMMMMSVSLIYQFWIHTEIIKKFPSPIEFIFNTPSHHRVHHASNIRYLDRNHAAILIIWDRIFGTYSEEVEEKPVYGIRKNIHTYNPFKIATHEFAALFRDMRKAPNLVTKLKYMIMPPGWSHDGSTLTANQLREALANGTLPPNEKLP